MKTTKPKAPLHPLGLAFLQAAAHMLKGRPPATGRARVPGRVGAAGAKLSRRAVEGTVGKGVLR